MNTDSIVHKIGSLKIQGAEGIAKAALKAIEYRSVSSDNNSFVLLKEKLESARPTEPCLRNALKYVFRNLGGKGKPEYADIKAKCEQALSYFNSSDDKIAEMGEKKVQNGAIIFTLCHSSTVIRILKLAKRKGKIFTVRCVETRPGFQGRQTAKELADSGITTLMYVDSAARCALRHADLCLIGADAITAEGNVINKIGSETVARVCCELDIPIYSCTNSWKFDPETIWGADEALESRAAKEIWARAPKGVTLVNPVFDIVKASNLSGIISEIGIYRPEVFVEELKQHYPWMFWQT